MSRAIVEMHVFIEQDIGDFDIDNDAVRESLQMLHATMLRQGIEKDATSKVQKITVKFHRRTDTNKLN